METDISHQFDLIRRGYLTSLSLAAPFLFKSAQLLIWYPRQIPDKLNFFGGLAFVGVVIGFISLATDMMTDASTPHQST